VEFHCLRIKSARQNCSYQISDALRIPRCYQEKPPTSEAKKDLIAFYNDNTIPEEYHVYFKNPLDCLLEPDLYDEDGDTDDNE